MPTYRNDSGALLSIPVFGINLPAGVVFDLPDDTDPIGHLPGITALPDGQPATQGTPAPQDPDATVPAADPAALEQPAPVQPDTTVTVEPETVPPVVDFTAN